TWIATAKLLLTFAAPERRGRLGRLQCFQYAQSVARLCNVVDSDNCCATLDCNYGRGDARRQAVLWGASGFFPKHRLARDAGQKRIADPGQFEVLEQCVILFDTFAESKSRIHANSLSLYSALEEGVYASFEKISHFCDHIIHEGSV